MPDALILPASPYKGPVPLERSDTIYGRKQEIEGLYDLICSSRIVLFHSQSGAGKTSLVQAGLIKKLEKDSFAIQGPERISTAGPAGLIAKLGATIPVASEEETGSARPRLWIIDQFEEILSDRITEEERLDFFEQMGKLLQDSMTFALFVIREDLLAALDPYRSRIPTQLNNRFRIGLLSVAVATDCIAKPAAKVGYPFAEGAAEMIAELLGPEVEPVYLQVVCSDLWRNAAMQAGRTKDRIDLEDVKALGDVSKAISSYYESVLKGIAGEDKRVEILIREWIGEKLITASKRRNQVMETAGASEGLDNELVAELVEALLVRRETRGNQEVWFELSHERLIEPILSSNERFRASLSAFERAMRRWVRSDRNDRFLVTGEELETLKQNLDYDSLDSDGRAFILACEAIEVAAIQKEQDKTRLERVSFLMAILFGMASAATLASYGFVATYVNAQELQTRYIQLVLGANLIGGLLAWPVFRIYVNDQRTTDLLSKLARKHRTDPSLQSIASEVPVASTPKVSTEESGLLSKWDRQTIDFLPYWILLIVAGADSRIHVGEVKALRKALRSSGFSEKEAVIEEFLQDPRPAVKGLQDAAAILSSKFEEGEAARLRKKAVQIAYALFDGDAEERRSLEYVKAVLNGDSTQDMRPGMMRYYKLSGISSTAALVQVCVAAGFAAVLLSFPYAWLQSMMANNYQVLLLALRGALALVFGVLVGGVSLLISFFTDMRDHSVLKVVSTFVVAVTLYVRWAVHFEVLWPQEWPAKLVELQSKSGLGFFIGLGVVEGILIAIPCYIAGWLALSGVYCEGCSQWADLASNVMILREPSDVNAMVADLENARLTSLEPLVEKPKYSETAANWVALDLESCASCNDLHALTLLQCSATTGKKGERSEVRDEVMSQLLINRRMAEWIRLRGKGD